MNYHGRIMNIPSKLSGTVDEFVRRAYQLGHRDARHDAAEIAAEAEAEVERLRVQLALVEQAGVAAQAEADRHRADLAAVRAERDGLARILSECADELENEITARYVRPGETTIVYSSDLRRYNRDMTTVREARAALAALPTPPKEEAHV